MNGLVSALRTDIGYSIVPRCVITGTFTETNQQQVALGCEDGNVLIYDCDKIDETKPKAVLSFKEQITCIIRLSWGPNGLDFIGIGSGNSIQVYNAYENVSQFYKKLDYSITTLTAGFVALGTESWLICGGGNALTGFDMDGKEVYWNVSSDTINTTCLADLTNRTRNQVVIGTDDGMMSVFDAEELVDTRNETSPVLLLVQLNATHVSYATENGTIGVYKNLERLWRIKSKTIAACQTAYKVGTMVEGVLTGWMNGRWELRRLTGGEMCAKGDLQSSIGGIVTGSFSHSHHESVMIVDAQGEMEIFTPLNEVKQSESSQKQEMEIVRKLTSQQEALKMEVNSLKPDKGLGNLSIGERAQRGIIPVGTEINARLKHAPDGRLLAEVEVTNDLVIFLVILLSDGLFKNSESKLEVSRMGERVMCIPIDCHCNTHSVINIKASVGYPGSEILHVIEETLDVPRFSFMVPQTAPVQCPEYVEFATNERVQRMILWVKENFLISNELSPKSTELDLGFKSSTQTLNFAFTLLRSTCQFDEVKSIPDIFTSIHQIQESLSRMDSELAEIGQRALGDLVRLEDGRVLEDYGGLEMNLNALMIDNNELIQKYRTKEMNKQRMVDLLKQLNMLIDAGSKLRIGTPASDVLAACRNAVKTRKAEVVTNVILHGVQ